MFRKCRIAVVVLAAALLLVGTRAVSAQGPDPNGAATLAANPDAPVNFVWVLLAGFLVFFMQAGFALVEAGFARAKNTVNILTKNFGLLHRRPCFLGLWLRRHVRRLGDRAGHRAGERGPGLLGLFPQRRRL